MAKKFELTAEFVTNIFGKKLFRIKALMAFGDVEEGELGGYLEKEENLDHDGDAWVSGNAQVYGNARVSGDAEYTTIKGFGRECRTTTFFRLKNGEVGVRCGCFYGTIEQFREKVQETQRDSKYAKEYLMIADLMELHFEHEEGKKCG